MHTCGILSAREIKNKTKKMQLIFAQIVVLYLYRIKSGNSFENIDSGKQSTK